MPDQKEIFINSLIAILLGVYGVYLIWSAIMILWKKKQILEPNKYIQIFLLKLSGNRDDALDYEKRLKEEKNWSKYGKFVLVFGLVCVFFAYRIWIIVP